MVSSNIMPCFKYKMLRMHMDKNFNQNAVSKTMPSLD